MGQAIGERQSGDPRPAEPTTVLAPDLWAGTWLKGRCWEETVPTAARPEQVFIRENTPEWRCWQRHLKITTGRSMPVNSQGGWWFSSRLPPLTDAEVPLKGQAHSSHEAPLDAESCPQHFTRRWPARTRRTG